MAIMKRRFLFVAMSAALWTVTPAAARSGSEALPLFEVTEVALVLAAGGSPTASQPPNDIQRGWTNRINGAPLAALIPSASLGDAGRREEALRLLDEGHAIAVTSQEGEPRHELETFGVEPVSRSAIYAQGPEGLVVASISAGLDPEQSRQATYHAIGTVIDAIHRTNEKPAMNLSRDAGDPENDERSPTVRIDDHVFGNRGRSATQTIRILRDTADTHDWKRIIVETDVAVVPEENAGPGRDGQWGHEGQNVLIAVPSMYVARTNVTTEAPGANLRLLQALPLTNGTTHRTITDEMISRSAFGLSVSSQVRAGLGKNGVSPLGKVAVDFSATSETTHRSMVEMHVDDYAVVQSATPHGTGVAATWSFPLASDIAGNPGYFNEGKLLSTRRMTPMMRGATLSTATEWRIEGAYEGKVSIASRGTVENRHYVAQTIGTFPSTLVADPASADYSPSSESDAHLTKGLQPWVVTVVDLSSAYLTRSPTVLLQSLSGNGACVSAASSVVTMALCDKTNRAQQWVYEADSTYRNRATGHCLTTDQGNGSVSTLRCIDNALNQQWKWSADRIHSMVEGGDRWHLHLRDGAINARFDPANHQPIAANPNHFLLKPWSSYPMAPSAEDWVPVLAGDPPRFQKAAGITYAPVSTERRWQTIPIRQGL